MDLACGVADGDTQGQSVIFPSSEIATDQTDMDSGTLKLTTIRRIWVTECIAYQDGAKKMHHTKCWIMSFYIPETPPPTVINRMVSGNRTVTQFTLPINGWEIVKTEAD
jgi:hypothetical protein